MEPRGVDSVHRLPEGHSREMVVTEVEVKRLREPVEWAKADLARRKS